MINYLRRNDDADVDSGKRIAICTQFRTSIGQENTFAVDGCIVHIRRQLTWSIANDRHVGLSSLFGFIDNSKYNGRKTKKIHNEKCLKWLTTDYY